MASIPDNVRKILLTLVPTSFINELSCFIFYDDHPRDKKNIDVTICTIHGEVIEFYQREIVCSTIIDNCSKPQSISILRSPKCELFYLVAFKDELVLLSNTNVLKIHHRVNNVERYEIEDSMCKGKACLKIIRKDDGVPLIFDENFEKLGDRVEILSKEKTDESLPILTQLARKLTEAKYSVKCNEKVLKDLVNLRQLAAYSNTQELAPKDHSAVFQGGNEGPCGALQIQNPTPWVKLCNKKIVVSLEVLNTDVLPTQDVHILLHNTTHKSMVYTTKLFEKIPASPFWKEKPTNTVTNGQTSAIVLLIDLKELKYCVTSKINLCGMISYTTEKKEYLLPFEKISISALDTMGENFDVLSRINNENNGYNILALLATTERIDLCLRHIKKEEELFSVSTIDLMDLFCQHLCMERIVNIDNVVIHRRSPYHILHGVMVVQEKDKIGEDKWIISLYTRSQSQIMAFIHYMYDAIPYRIIATTTSQKIATNQPQLSKYEEDIYYNPRKLNYSGLGQSILKQADLTIEYFDDCMMKMNESKNPVVQSKIGSEIDIFAGGTIAFKEYRRNMLEEAEHGVKLVHEEISQNTEGMVIDLDD